MNKNKFLEVIISELQQYLKLNNWQIFLKLEKLDDNLAGCIQIDYSHLKGYINLDDNFIKENLNKSGLDNILDTIIHELCHIFTGAGTGYFEYQKDVLYKYMGDLQYTGIYNHIIQIEEQMTSTIDNVIMEAFKKTKEYKQVYQVFNKHKKTILI